MLKVRAIKSAHCLVHIVVFSVGARRSSLAMGTSPVVLYRSPYPVPIIFSLDTHPSVDPYMIKFLILSYDSYVRYFVGSASEATSSRMTLIVSQR